MALPDLSTGSSDPRPDPRPVNLYQHGRRQRRHPAAWSKIPSQSQFRSCAQGSFLLPLAVHPLDHTSDATALVVRLPS